MNSKIELGQFYTKKSPFEFERFQVWFRALPNFPNLNIIEPFGGSNAIIKMILDEFEELTFKNWSSFDIQPEAQQNNLVPMIKLMQQDTLKEFPDGFDMAITNPPYLAKNSATRKGSGIDFGVYQDLFEISLERMLFKCKYVAAIIPESFITRKLFTDRLEFVISLNLEMFDDTEFPVCLAVFGPDKSNDFEIWRSDTKLGNFSELHGKIENLLVEVNPKLIKFNDPNGVLGLTAIDSTTGPTIRFRHGQEIDSSKIKVYSRAETRMTSELFEKVGSLDELIAEANNVLCEYRTISHDVFITSFKGLRMDGLYRRRLDWSTTGRLLGTTLIILNPKLENLITPGTRLL